MQSPAESSNTQLARLRHWLGRERAWPVWTVLALALLLAYNAAFTQGSFFEVTVRDGRLYGATIDILKGAAPLAIVALGMTLVIGTGGIDLSVGALAAVAGSVAATLMLDRTTLAGDQLVTVAGYSALWAITAAMLVCGACGAVSGVLVAYVGVQPIVATLIMMVAGRGIAQGVGQNVPIGDTGFLYLGTGFFASLPFSIALAGLLLGLTVLLARGTALGLFIQAIGNNPLASRYAGVRVRPLTLFVYVFSGLCAGLAGLLIASNVKAADASRHGLFMELDAILAVVVGGTALTGGRFALVGSVLGAVLIQTMTVTIYRSDLGWSHALIVKASVVLAVCLLQSAEFRRRLRLRRGV